MPGTLVVQNLTKPLTPLPPHLVALMRPELPSLFAEITAEICANIPGYAALLDGPYGNLIKQSIQRNVSTFITRVADPNAPSPERDEVCRTAGRLEALNGHSMDRLQTAYRIGVQVAWRRWTKVAKRHNIPTPVMTTFADALFGYVEEMATLSRAGHAAARDQSAHHLIERRAQLLSHLLTGQPTPGTTLTELADRAAWPLPSHATAVAIRSGDGLAPARKALDCDVLAALDDPQPHLLIPGPVTPAREQMLTSALGTARSAIGLTVPLSHVAHSLRWARRTLTLTEASPGADTAPTRSENHLLSLWLLSDAELTQQIAERQLAPLRALTDARQRRCIDTLLAWFAAHGSIDQMANILEVHPQTVRYRMKALNKTLGPLLDDPEWRLATELALRGQRLGAASPQTPD